MAMAWTNKKYRPSVQAVSQLSLSQAPHGFGAPYRGFPVFPAPSNCLKTAKLRRLTTNNTQQSSRYLYWRHSAVRMRHINCLWWNDLVSLRFYKEKRKNVTEWAQYSRSNTVVLQLQFYISYLRFFFPSNNMKHAVIRILNATRINWTLNCSTLKEKLNPFSPKNCLILQLKNHASIYYI